MAEDYYVEDGDCVSSIAFEHGFFWETLWNHGKNAELKQKRTNPNMLKPYDILHIPELTLNEEERPTEKKHKFKLKGAVKLCLRIMETPKQAPTARANQQTGGHNEEQGTSGQAQPTGVAAKDEPHSALSYLLIIEGRDHRGQTDNRGMLECLIPPNAKDGRLILEPGTPQELTIQLKIGSLQPVEEVAGAQARLNNLGFASGPVDGIAGPRTKAALLRFQEQNGLNKSGELDQATKDKLREAHDSSS